MEIKSIFALQNTNESLYTVVFDTSKESAYDDFYETYRNVDFLEDYFEKNKERLQYLHPNITVTDAVLSTIDEVEELHGYLIELTNQETNDDLEYLFKPFHNKFIKEKLTESKAYGVYKKSWIRLYAIRVDYNLYVITGGGIKLVRATQDDALLNQEVERMEFVRDYLLKEGIISEDEIKEF